VRVAQVSLKRDGNALRRMSLHMCVSRAAQVTARQHQSLHHGANLHDIDGTLLTRSHGSGMLSHSASRACPGDIRILPGSLQHTGCDEPCAHACTCSSCARDPSDLCWQLGTVLGPDGVHGCLEWYIRRIAGLCASGPKASVQCLSNTLSRPCLMSKALKFINGDTLKVRHPRVVSHLHSAPARSMGCTRVETIHPWSERLREKWCGG